MTSESIGLQTVLAQIDDLWSPRIVTRVNDYDVRVAKFDGEYIWHAHDNTDEFFMVLDGELRIGLRDESGERVVVLEQGTVFVVPRGTEHKPMAPHRASILMFEPSGTLTVGDRHEDVRDDIVVTTGQEYS